MRAKGRDTKGGSRGSRSASRGFEDVDGGRCGEERRGEERRGEELLY
jgi:hypothetical protein